LQQLGPHGRKVALITAAVIGVHNRGDVVGVHDRVDVQGGNEGLGVPDPGHGVDRGR
jgi:hypothetical protein